MSEEPKFKVGDMADAARWDGTVSPGSRLGIREVMEVITGQQCESGVMVKLAGRERSLDQGWLVKVEKKQTDLGL